VDSHSCKEEMVDAHRKASATVASEAKVRFIKKVDLSSINLFYTVKHISIL
jgi:hypothetical protein